MPGGLTKNLWFDVSPLRPDEYGRQRAMRWTQASVDQRVHQDAMADVQQEAQGFQRLATAPAPRVD